MAGVVVSSTGGEAFPRLAKDLQKTMKGFNRVVARKVVPTVERFTDRLVKLKLRKYPPPRRAGKFIWSLDATKQARARRWWFANKKGKHVRTGAMGEAWEFELAFNPTGQALFLLQNKSKGASYVYGYKPQGYAQVPTHKQTGWQNVGVVGVEIINASVKEYDKTLDNVLTAELMRL